MHIQSRRPWYRIVLAPDILDPDRGEEVRNSGSLEETLRIVRGFMAAFESDPGEAAAPSVTDS